jgi:hypothetical protein
MQATAVRNRLVVGTRNKMASCIGFASDEQLEIQFIEEI